MGKPMIRFYIFTQTCIAIAAAVMLIAEILLFVVSPTYARIACEASPPAHMDITPGVRSMAAAALPARAA